MTPCVRCLAPRGVLFPTFDLDSAWRNGEWVVTSRLVPRCDCWARRPRWAVVRWFYAWWRCADCGRFGRKEAV